MNSKILPLALVIISIIGTVLHSQKKLIPIIRTLSERGPYDGVLGTNVSLKRFAIALIAYLLVISFLSEKDAFYLTLAITFLTVMNNIGNRGQNALI